MSTLHNALALTSIAFMIGVGVVLASIQYRPFGASFDTRPVMASDDMGTSGVSYASDVAPPATSSIH
jgi:hypothetical protein